MSKAIRCKNKYVATILTRADKGKTIVVVEKGR
jgi:hypothetical protein